jgi:biopolymer transport protein ExbD
VNLRRYQDEEPDLIIDIAPLIDVVFILLIFFMVSTTFNHEAEIEIKLPASVAQEPTDMPDNLIEISINAQGDYFLNGQTLVNQQTATLHRALTGLLPTTLEARQNFSVRLNADGRAPHQAVVTAMDVARRVGVHRLTFVIDNMDANP